MDEGRLVHRVEPLYPRLAIISRIQGTVELAAVIARDGSIENLQLLGAGKVDLACALADAAQGRGAVGMPPQLARALTTHAVPSDTPGMTYGNGIMHVGNNGRDLKAFLPEQSLPMVAGGPYTVTRYAETGTTIYLLCRSL